MKQDQAYKDLLSNAISSLKIAIEDYHTGVDARQLSAVRNLYSGILLLAKANILCRVKFNDPMEVLATKFIPKVDGEGNIDLVPKSNQTVGFTELDTVYKSLNLNWPKKQIESLGRIRNDVEHYFCTTRISSVRNAISSSLPVIVDLLEQQNEGPKYALDDIWETLLKEDKIYKKEKDKCDKSFSMISWYSKLQNKSGVQCRGCRTPLICLIDPEDTTSKIVAECLTCSEIYNQLATIEMFAESENATECHCCGNDTFVSNEMLNGCLYCITEESLE